MPNAAPPLPAGTGGNPWEPDRPLDVETARSIIRAAFPHVDVTRFDHVGSGWEFDVFISADGWAFRFPRRAEYARRFEHEGPVLALVRSALPAEIAVPRVELLGAPSREFPYTFAGHRYIEGVAVDAVDRGLRGELARGVGAALGAIHSIPTTAARDAGVREAEPPNDGAREWVRRNLDGASHLTGSNRTVRDAVEWVSALDDPIRPLTRLTRFTHNDLAPEHMLAERSTGRLVGMLDWTDAALGDPARDFVTCVTFAGWGFVERVLAHYPEHLHRAFHERLRFMAQFLSVMWLGEARHNGGDVEKHIMWVENAF